jgi:putative inorganic carbon (HCO3(-)) transporter
MYMVYLLELLIALAPTYVIHIGRFDLLELLVVAFWAACLALLTYRDAFADFKNYIVRIPRSILVSGGLFLLAAIISTVISPTHARALGELTAYFLQPAITFFFAGYILHEEKNKEHFTKFILWYVAALAAYAILQYFTLLGLPTSWWGNANEPKRALSVFAYPNALALFITPLLAYAMPFVFTAREQSLTYKILFLIGVIGLGLSLSRGGWLGLIAAAIVFLFLGASLHTKKLFGIAAIILAAIILITPNLRYRVELPFKGEKSTVSRYSLWATAEKMIRSSPVLGKGLNGFAADFTRYNTDPNLAPLDYPHNIFLNFYVETGLLGLLSFIALTCAIIWQGWKTRIQGAIYGLAVILFIVALSVHGLVDAPYFKNDLALLFWVTISSVA